jgi:uncharacterized protein with HEPN domain
MDSKLMTILEHMLEDAQEAVMFVKEIHSIEEFRQDPKTRKAVVMSLLNIGELASRLPKAFMDSYPDIPWKMMIGMRNIAAHGYHIMNINVIWDTVHTSIPVNSGSYKTSVNRSYYCIFHAMRAVLALDALDSKKHSGIISVFRQKYIKTGVLPKKLSSIIDNAFDTRNSSDYEDFFVISKPDTQKQMESAKTFLTAVESYIDMRIQTP